MQEQVLQFINDHNLFGKEHQILVAVSGGQDSIVLAHYLHEAGFKIAIAHCNFQLRAKESDQDEAFVKRFATMLGVPYHVQRFETKAFSKGMKMSTQEAARELRYAYFYELLEVHGYDYIATGHHQQDQLETVLINQIRGTGVKGLAGIPRKNGLVVRPMLETEKVEIDYYAKDNGLKWRDDSSNTSDDYLRNKIRHQLIPPLEKIEPQVAQIVMNNANKVGQAYELLMHLVEESSSDLLENEEVEGDFRISIYKLRTYPQRHLVLYHLLNSFGFSHQQCAEIAQLLESESGRMVQNADYGVWRDRKYLLVHRIDNIPFSLEIPDVGTYEFPYGTLEVSMVENNNIDFKQTPRNQCLVDAGKVQFPLLVRNWEQGDKFQPLGMTGTKLVSDFFVDLKLPVFKKKQVPIVLSQEKIIWVGGFRPDHRFKVDKGSKQIIRITFE